MIRSPVGTAEEIQTVVPTALCLFARPTQRKSAGLSSFAPQAGLVYCRFEMRCEISQLTKNEQPNYMKTIQRTLSIIKPDAFERGATGDIIHTLLENKFRIVGMKMLHITKAQAEGFYAVHVHRPFFESLTDFMSSAPIVVIALEKEDAIADYRKLMGATDPAKAEAGTIRKKWASRIEQNAVHGSDAEDTSRFELSYFFAGYELSK